MSASCSVVIRCYNEAKRLPRLLFGLSRQTMRDFEVVAVDSGSTDDTPRILAAHGVRTLFLTPGEFSFGRSCNLGCQASRGEYIVFVSAHAYPVYEGWLEELLAPFADPGVAASYGKQRGNHESAFSERRIFEAWYPDRDPGAKGHPFCNNANSAVRRRVWEEIGFDETLTGLEDLDFARRAVERGHSVAYAPAAEVIHVHEERPGTVRDRFRREAIAYRRISPRERFTWWDFCRLCAGNVVSDWRAAWREGVLAREARAIVIFRLMQFLGAYQGMRQTGPVPETLKRRLYYPAAPVPGPASPNGSPSGGRVPYPERL
ncbi:glycosyltransferase family 2 protein [Desulfolutivibrio sulfoxidireducens]|uniref:glycosyltransferase family 2 protein n=1 Tax=Desulfolutivibrio sulfoxidireducens TaxID=2773299 RepID=UPI00159D6A77|nr:glycosyltransferase [Desulfolutivibrio sulfoxidireducens]QLA14815.1 glycosyltransferase [Desulfolutivibrio sulfoxidireducens]